MLIIAHRGNNNDFPENSLAAIQSASDLKVDMIEVDIRVTKDNVAILYHDKHILSGDKKALVSNLAWDEIANINKDITTLESALNITGVNYLLEIKPDVKLEPIIKLLLDHGDRDRITITSFDYKILKEIRNKLPGTKIAILDKWSGVRATTRAKALGSRVIIINQRWLWGGFIKSVKNGGYDLYTYTLNDPDKARKWNKLGLDGVITDSLQLFKS